jgi:hypothetical protein
MEQESALVRFVVSAFNFPSHRHVGPSNGKRSIILVGHNGPLRSNKRRNAVLINLRCDQWQCQKDCRRGLQYTGVPNSSLSAILIGSTYTPNAVTATYRSRTNSGEH